MPPVLVLRAVRELGDLLEPLRVPALSSILGAATVLLEELEISKANNRARDALAEQVREAVFAIDDQLRELDDPNAMADEVLCAIDALGTALNRAHFDLFQQRTRRGGVFTRLLRAGPDADALRYARDDVQRAFAIYKLQAHVYMSRTTFELSRIRTQNPAKLRPDMLDNLASQENGKLGEQLPTLSATFIGREEELARIVKILVRDDTLQHPVLLGGPGIGKTTLAHAVLHNETVCTTFHKRFFVDCGAHHTIAALYTGHGLSEKQFLSALRSKGSESAGPRPRVLLILDGFDVPLAGDLTASDFLLKLCTTVDGLSVLVTMRGADGPSNVQMTKEFLKPLDHPSSQRLLLALLPATGAEWDDSTTETVLKEADGVPLAITLLASRTASASTGTAVSQGTSAFPDGGLDSIIASSVARVGPDAAEALALLARAPEGLLRSLLPARGVAGLLRAALASQCESTPLAASNDPPEGRVRVLAPIRAYAMAHLEPSPDGLQRLRSHYVALALASAQEIGGSATSRVVRVLQFESGNLNSILCEHVLDSSISDASWHEAVEACVALTVWRHTVTSRDTALLETCSATIRVRAPSDDALLGRVLAALARLQTPASDASRKLGDEALACARRANDVGTEVDVLARRLIKSDEEDMSRLEHALQLLDAMDLEIDENKRRRTLVFFELGQTHMSASRFSAAAECFASASSIAKQIPNGLYLRARALNSSGHVAIHRGQLQDASRLYVQAMGVAEAADHKGTAAHSIAYQGWVNLEQRRFSQCRELYLEAARRYVRLGLEMDEVLARSQAVRAGVRMGLQLQDEAEYLTRMTIPESWIYGKATVLLARGEVARVAGYNVTAKALVQEAQQLFWKRKAEDRAAECQAVLGDVEEENEEARVKKWIIALAMFLKLDDALGCRRVLWRLMKSSPW